MSVVEQSSQPSMAISTPTDAVPEWLQALRSQGADAFATLGFPTRKDEHWRYTPLTALNQSACLAYASETLSPQEHLGAVQTLSETSQLTPNRIVFIDGQYSDSLSTLPEQTGITILPLAEACADQTHNEQLQSILPIDMQDGFSALNTAQLQHGIFVHAGKNVQLEKPLLIEIMSTNQQANVSSPLRFVFSLEQSANVTTVMHYQGSDAEAYFNNIVIQSRLAANAQLNTYQLQQEGAQATHIARTFVDQAKDSVFNAYSVALGSALARSDVHARLQGQGAHIGLYGLFTPQGKQVLDHHTNIEHIAANCTSYAQFKGIARDQARGVFNGKVHVHPDAQKTDSAQYSQNLLLSSQAEIDTKPELEIYADDVKCAHGATVGQLDEQALFYLQARGIDQHTATQLLQLAFARDVLDKFVDPDIKAWAADLAIQCLSGDTQLTEAYQV